MSNHWTPVNCKLQMFYCLSYFFLPRFAFQLPTVSQCLAHILCHHGTIWHCHHLVIKPVLALNMKSWQGEMSWWGSLLCGADFMKPSRFLQGELLYFPLLYIVSGFSICYGLHLGTVFAYPLCSQPSCLNLHYHLSTISFLFLTRLQILHMLYFPLSLILTMLLLQKNKSQTVSRPFPGHHKWVNDIAHNIAHLSPQKKRDDKWWVLNS